MDDELKAKIESIERILKDHCEIWRSLLALVEALKKCGMDDDDPFLFAIGSAEEKKQGDE